MDRTFVFPPSDAVTDRRMLTLSGLAILLGIAAGVVAQIVTRMIGFVTNLAFFGEFSTELRTPVGNHLGAWLLLIPIGGGIIVGLMARYGSKAIRGHGIPETMEQVLLNQSRIPPRIIILKPLSAALAIGTGGPFGAEGPIIATGGALGSLLGQLLHTTADERKTLLAAGAAAGMAAIFGSPVSAVLLAIELLLFEFRSRSFIPVAIACVAATATRAAVEGLTPIFYMPALPTPSEGAIVAYFGIGALVGVLSVGVTKLTYWIEDQFERLPIHWMWWPAIGGIAVGVCGLVFPRSMGVGYDNISGFLNGSFAWQMLLSLAVFKLISWSIALGSGTSGGTLAPLFTIGGAFGALAAIGLKHLFPELAIDSRMAGLIGMAAMFAGAARSLLASTIFAFETTLQSSGLLPLLAGCSAAYLLSSLLMRHTIMTEKIARRGLAVPSDYSADFLERQLVKDVITRDVRTLDSTALASEIQRRMRDRDPYFIHQGYPVIDQHENLIGVVTQKEMLSQTFESGELLASLPSKKQLFVVTEAATLREAADLMVQEGIGRLPVVLKADPHKLVGIITRSDLLHAHEIRINESKQQRTTIGMTTISGAISDLRSPFSSMEKPTSPDA